MAKTILVVDDHLNVRNILKFNLQRKGYNVLTIDDGGSVLPMVMKEKIDLVLLDIMLPDIDGFKVLDSMKAKGVIDKSPVIVLSAKGEESDILTALKKGARDYVVKPFNFEVLYSKINRLLHTTMDTSVASTKEEEPKARVMTLGRNIKHAILIQITAEFEEDEANELEENLNPLVESGWTNICIDFKPGIKVKTIAIGKLVKIQQEIAKRGGVIYLIVRDNEIETHFKEANFAKYFTIFKSFDEAFSLVSTENT
ncbi:MAG: response regulator [Candidatus Hydrogenedentota bacterium]